MYEPTTRPSLEQRLVRDEARLAIDEARLASDEAELRASRIVSWLGFALAGVLGIAVAALVLSVLALRQDVGALGRSAPAGTVGTAALRDGSVSAAKLAPDAVGRDAIVPAA